MSRRQRVLSVFGTRPEAIKMAPVVAALAADDRFDSRVCVTAQHREMLDDVLGLFAIEPDHDLAVMQPGQTPNEVAAAVLSRIDPVLRSEAPDWVLVQGDTTTVMATALAAFHLRIRVGHVEAGLRTGDRWQPFPEEVNRRVATLVTDLHFAPTERARDNLLREAVADEDVILTGNTVIDALLDVAARPFEPAGSVLQGIPFEDRRVVLVTSHRRENFGAPLRSICTAVADLARAYEGDVHVVYPVHPNPQVQAAVSETLVGVDGVTLLSPLDYLSLVQLMKRSHLILTDSGGIQEEAPSLGVPVLVLRDVTERPEAIDIGAARIVGADAEVIGKEARRLLDDPQAYAAMAKGVNPYGDGHAAERIRDALWARAPRP